MTRFSVFRSSDVCGTERPCAEAEIDGKGRWFVTIDTIEDLLAFATRHDGEIIVSCDDMGNYSVEIYDTYRE